MVKKKTTKKAKKKPAQRRKIPARKSTKATKSSSVRSKREKVMAALIETSSIFAAARKCRYSVSTVRRWLADDKFQEEYQRHLRALVDDTVSALRQSGPKAVKALLAKLEEKNAKASDVIAAARVLLDNMVKMAVPSDKENAARDLVLDLITSAHEKNVGELRRKKLALAKKAAKGD